MFMTKDKELCNDNDGKHNAHDDDREHDVTDTGYPTALLLAEACVTAGHA